ncbi:MAG: agmatinase family protein [Alistipes sp.]|nr:agmatinase family protein [Alistipes sp.]
MNIADFDPEAACAANGSCFGFPFTEEESRVVLVTVPWDVTVSYGSGASRGPEAVIEASTQLDFFDAMGPDLWRRGIATVEAGGGLAELSQRLRAEAVRVIAHLESGGAADESVAGAIAAVNEGCRRMNRTVYERCAALYAAGKIAGLIGGDHSVSYGAIKAAGEAAGEMGVLHIDAHCDLREAYEGFEFSHASVMYNVLRDVPQVSRIVEVGVRDFCRSEYSLASSSERVRMFDGRTLARNRFGGVTWERQCREIVGALPGKVYISFDIDGLSHELCPHTGTPVPGGLTFDEAVYLIEAVAESGREIVGFDVVEVVPGGDDRTDGIVGARIVWKLAVAALAAEENREGKIEY